MNGAAYARVKEDRDRLADLLYDIKRILSRAPNFGRSDPDQIVAMIEAAKINSRKEKHHQWRATVTQSGR